MKTTKNDILQVSLRLFAEKGFQAVSTGMIAAELGITKGALYRHFTGKQQIFDSIIQRMYELDAQRAQADGVPEQKLADAPESYEDRRLTDLCAFTRDQFLFWTEDPFASDFRRMITIEQYTSPAMQQLYQDVIGQGPVDYTADLLRQMNKEGQLNDEAVQTGEMVLAVLLFAPLSLAISMADGGADKAELQQILRSATHEFEKRWMKDESDCDPA